MPNIEIHGMPQEGAEQVEREIFKLFSSELFLNDMVVTIFPTTVRNASGEKQPFLRVVTTESLHTEIIISKLRKGFRHLAGIDIEHLRLEAFYPK